MCTRSGEQEATQTLKDDKGKSINRTNYQQRGLGLQIKEYGSFSKEIKYSEGIPDTADPCAPSGVALP